MSRKKKDLTPAQQIEARLATKSFAKLEEEINKIIAARPPDVPLETVFGTNLDSGPVWGSGGPPHMILGRPVPL